MLLNIIFTSYYHFWNTDKIKKKKKILKIDI